MFVPQRLCRPMAAVWSKAGASLGHVMAARTPEPRCSIPQQSPPGHLPRAGGTTAAECTCTYVASRSPVGTDWALIGYIIPGLTEPRLPARIPACLGCLRSRHPSVNGQMSDFMAKMLTPVLGRGEQMGEDSPETHCWGTRGLQRPAGSDC